MKIKLQDTGNLLGGMVEHLERVVPRSEAEVSVVQQRLITAGFREDTAVKFFYSAKVLCPLLLCAIALVTGLGGKSPIFIYIACVGIGFLVPDFVLGKIDFQPAGKDSARTARRARHAGHLRRGRPQPRPGNSQNRGGIAPCSAGPERRTRDGRLEQRAGSARADAWKHLADRTGVDSVRNLVSMLVQSEQFGTSIAKTLRVHSDMLRTKRVQEIEEKAAKLSIKLLFPLVLFIFPALFVVVIGPAAIIMAQSFKTMFNH